MTASFCKNQDNIISLFEKLRIVHAGQGKAGCVAGGVRILPFVSLRRFLKGMPQNHSAREDAFLG